MEGGSSGLDCDTFNWNTDDELEIETFTSSSSSHQPLPNGSPTKEIAAAGPSNSKSFDYFVSMGFCEKMVAKAIEENGEGNTDSILETLLTYSALEKSPPEQTHVESDHWSSEYERSSVDDFSDVDIYSEDEETGNPVNSEMKKLISLVNMGYKEGDVLVAIERCGPESTIVDLTDFISAAQVSKDADALLPPEDAPIPRRRQLIHHDILRKKKKARAQNEDDETIRPPKPMIGFGVPNGPTAPLSDRRLPEPAIGPPYFYYENVALAPKGVWSTISRFLYDVEPEFVDSKYFCAAARKRAYVHNLPIQNRFPLLPLPPQTIHEALPLTKKWWPPWDERSKLNCLQTCIASAKLTERIRKALESFDDIPPLSVQKYVMDECRKWNLVWVGRNKVAPLEPDEVEMLLGFPKNHTRGGGISRTDRFKSLGNSFQVDTVAYHFSVLKGMFPDGINLLSLFSGIGGAEVALHRLGIRLKTVVSVEISEANRNIVRSWWEQTGQKGKLIDIADVQHLNPDRLEEIMENFGAFDLVVGGSPCNNLTGSNRHSRDGLEGKDSSLFYDFYRILDLVKGRKR